MDFYPQQEFAWIIMLLILLKICCECAAKYSMYRHPSQSDDMESLLGERSYRREYNYNLLMLLL